ncbi:helix-turn-helix domain-containing protein [Umezawaea sp.]|uniref:winged helix-turn-helix transcriptional regulator n=1 Tax=Umezawaea sp. TaxID=1955258 RepID=UPI002ED6AC26
MPLRPSVSDDVTALPRGGQNAIGVALGLLGDEWTLLVLRHALSGTRLYGDWMRAMPISHAVLAGRLGRLTQFGLLERVVYSQRPERFEYRLTRRGRGVWPILLGIWSWELTHVERHAEELPRMGHRGHAFEPVLVCGGCAAPVRPRDLVGGFGPSGTWARSMPSATTRRRSAAAPGHQDGFFPQTTALVGNRWSCAMLGAAFQGARRFGDFERHLSAPPVVVADRLRTFAELDVVTASANGGYRLTPKGLAFFPVAVHTMEWAQRWFRSPEGPALAYRHTACGAPFHPRYSCSGCGEQLRGSAVQRLDQ